MNQAGTIIAGVGAVVGLLILAGLAIALVKGSYNRARIEALRSSLDDTDKELVRERGRRERLEDRVRHVEAENETLKNLVLQRSEFESINAAIRTHNTEASTNWTDLNNAMTGYYQAIIANQKAMLAVLEA